MSACSRVCARSKASDGDRDSRMRLMSESESTVKLMIAISCFDGDFRFMMQAKLFERWLCLKKRCNSPQSGIIGFAAQAFVELHPLTGRERRGDRNHLPNPKPR